MFRGPGRPCPSRSTLALGLLLLAILVGVNAWAGRRASAATTLTVTSTIDAPDQTPGDGVCATAGGVCTLRAAIQEANSLAGPDVIIVPAGTYLLTIGGTSEDAAATGDLDITDDLELRGAGALRTIVDAAEIDRVFQVLAPARATVTGITARRGRGDGPGGGFLNNNALTITESIVSESFGTGGGLYNSGALVISRSAIISNTSGGDQGAGQGGGIHQASGTLVITNTTFSGNSALTGFGGAIYVNSGQVTIASSTIVSNTAANASGLANFDTVALRGTILANGGPGANCAFPATSLGQNVSSETSCGLTGSGDQPSVDPRLLPLADNGGQTLTHALAGDSPARDQGGSACPIVDQRGIARPQGAACDVGAYELAPTSASPTPTPSRTVTPAPTNTIRATGTPTITPTGTAIPTTTATPTGTLPSTGTPTRTMTPSPTSTAIPTTTATPTGILPSTGTPTSTIPSTPMGTPTPTATPTPEGAVAQRVYLPLIARSLATATPTPTSTSPTSPATSTATSASSSTGTATAAPSATATATRTTPPTPTGSPAATPTPTRTPIPADLFVDNDNTTGVEDGSARNPYKTVQQAIDAASGRAVIAVAAGTYPQNLRVQNKTVLLYGGYQGGAASDYAGGAGGNFSVRDPAANPSHLQGNGQDSVITLVEAGTSILDGFRVTGGSRSVDVLPSCLGGGLYVTGGAPTLSNNVIENNNTCPAAQTGQEMVGGGIYASGADIAILDNLIRNNTSGRGAGIAINGGNVVIRGNTVQGNVGLSDHGGGLYIFSPNAEISRNRIVGNEIGRALGYGWGGGIMIFNQGAFATLSYNLITANYAPSVGSAVFIDDGARVVLEHELIYANACNASGGVPAIYVDGTALGIGSTLSMTHTTVAGHNCDRAVAGNAVVVQENSGVTIRNSILWGNGGDDVEVDATSRVTVTYTLSEEAIAGIGNLSTDPLFADPASQDYHPRSTAGRWDPAANGGTGAWVQDRQHSPAIDAGDPASPFAAEPEPNGSQANLGAYGNTPWASKSAR